MRGAVVLCLCISTAIGDIPGSVVHLASDVPMAEAHSLDGAMNVVVTDGVNPEDCQDRTAMAMKPFLPLSETKESLENGMNNADYLSQRKLANALLPVDLRHKPLTDVWKKETPCECPFNVWKPVCGVDGNTYPTECFAKCINMDIYVYADCKYVRRELWKKMMDKIQSGVIPTSNNYDENELCVESEDDDPEDPRPKCPRKIIPSPETGPFPEGQEPPPPVMAAQIQQPNVGPFPEGEEPSVDTTPPAPRTLPATPTASSDSAPAEEPSGKIEYRVFNGMRVPYYTGDVANPCPDCGLGYKPVCGADNKTYPSRCYAKCMDAAVAKEGECDVVM